MKSLVSSLLALWAILSPAGIAEPLHGTVRAVEDPVSGLILPSTVQAPATSSASGAAHAAVAPSGAPSVEESVTGIPTPLPEVSERSATAAAPAANAAPSAACLHTHAVAYAGLAQQPILRIKVTAPAGGTVTALELNSASTGNVADMADVQIYYSGSTPYFSLRSEGNAQAKATMNKLAKGAKKMSFSGSQAVAAGDNYFWVTCSVPARARGPKLDAACTSITLNGESIVPAAAADDEGCVRIFPYKYRIVPYFRETNLLHWAPDLLTTEHFKKMTDIIYCNVSVNSRGEVTESANSLGEGLEKLKLLRGNNDVNIMTCLMHCADTMPTIVRDETLRNTCAKNLADYIKNNGYDGIDLDWEYPTSSDLWKNYVLFVSKLREELGGKGIISAAVTPRYNGPTVVFCELLDFLNTMSYDAGGMHSTMAQLTDDVVYARDTLHLPACKVVGGLPFYTNETAGDRDWGQQYGYRDVIKWFPDIAPNVNLITAPSTGRQHYFNGISLIKSKCMYIVENHFGGVMIWAYDTDVMMSHPKSLAKAMYTIIKRTKR